MHSCSDTYIDPFYHLANYCTSISTRSLFYCCSVVLFWFFLLPRFLHLSGSPLTDCVLDGFYQDGCIKKESDAKDLLVKKYYKVIKSSLTEMGDHEKKMYERIREHTN